ncbi:MAG TPA: LCCL domain-containing protein [Steroidobacteraceae bacterium]
MEKAELIRELDSKASAMRGVLSIALIAALGCLSIACDRRPGAAAAPVLDWRTSALDLNLRGMNGQSYRFRCPAGKPVARSVTGSGVYTDASSICAAAAHAGAIDSQRGGVVTIQILPGQRDYRGSTQNFIRSDDYAHEWGGSFAVLSATDFATAGKP